MVKIWRVVLQPLSTPYIRKPSKWWNIQIVRVKKFYCIICKVSIRVRLSCITISKMLGTFTRAHTFRQQSAKKRLLSKIESRTDIASW